jgi:hypothetical protein
MRSSTFSRAASELAQINVLGEITKNPSHTTFAERTSPSTGSV